MGRMKQFADILSHSAKHIHTNPYQFICGDLNTLGHSIARLSRSFCCDDLRWKSIGKSESQFWTNKLFSFSIYDGPLNENLLGFSPRYLSHQDLVSLRNTGFIDPFHVNLTTLQNYKGLFKGKLDWTLCRAFDVLDQGLSNDTYKASDHKLLWLLVKPIKNPSEDKLKTLLHATFNPPRINSISVPKISIIPLLIFLLIYFLLHQYQQ